MKLICWLIALLTLGWRGHRWRLVRVNYRKACALIHLHSLAGVDADCARCGAEWRDADCGLMIYGDPLFGPVEEIEGEVYAFPCDGPTSFPAGAA